VSRILVLGAAGLLGINLAIEASADHEVIGTVHRRRLQEAPFETVSTDLLEADALPALLDAAKPDWLINCAALADVDKCEDQPDLAQALNVELPGRLAKEATKRSIALVHISTDAVFDGEKGNYKEEDPAMPLNVYGHSKLDGEQAVLEAYPQAIVARVNFFGWGLDGQRSLAEFFYNKLSLDETALGLTDRYFSPLLVNDLSKLLLRILEEELSGLFHVASPSGMSKYDFAVALAKRFGFDEELVKPAKAETISYVAPRAADLRLDTKKLQLALGEEIPDVHSGIEGLHALRQQGYPDQLKAIANAKAALRDRFK